MRKVYKSLQALRYFSKISRIITNRNYFFDMFFTRVLLGYSYDFYLSCSLYNQPWIKRKDYIYDDTFYALKYNPGVTLDNHDDKTDLISKINPYLKRKVISTVGLSYEAFSDFIKGLSSYFYKPFDGDGGHGIKKIYVESSDDEYIKKLYDDLKVLPKGLLEETIIQHAELDRLNPNAVQTIRIMIFLHHDGPKIIFATLRTGLLADAFIDNACSGGGFANINLETGAIQTNAYSKLTSAMSIENMSDINIACLKDGLEKHPITGVTFKGFQIPYFEEAKSMVIEIAKTVNFYNRRLLAFDIAITNMGPSIVEVNTTRPGISGLWQTALKDTPLKTNFENMLAE